MPIFYSSWLTKKMAVIQSVSKKVDCDIDAKCYAQSFNSSKLYSVWNFIASCLFDHASLAWKKVSFLDFSGRQPRPVSNIFTFHHPPPLPLAHVPFSRFLFKLLPFFKGSVKIILLWPLIHGSSNPPIVAQHLACECSSLFSSTITRMFLREKHLRFGLMT